MGMLERFTGNEGQRRLIETLQSQFIVHGDISLAQALASKCSLHEFPPGSELIVQDETDSDCYLILSGTVIVYVNGREVARRSSGTHVGEMALIDPSVKRSATVKTLDTTVVARLSEPEFAELASKYPKLWRRIAVEIAERLRRRSKYHKVPNQKPLVFIASSKEALFTADQLKTGLVTEDIIVKLWTDGIFQASATTIESLMAILEIYDFGIVVLSSDDITFSRGSDQPSPRDNIIFELGLLMGGIGRPRTIIVKPLGLDIKIPSDLLGITCLEIDVAADQLSRFSTRSVCDCLRSRIAQIGPK